MYHRDSVHADDFWQFEPTKPRQAHHGLQIHDDLWHQQLGKHAESSPDMTVHDPGHEDKWLEQIRPTGHDDMKLLAFQSLHSSLQVMAAPAGFGHLAGQQPLRENAQTVSAQEGFRLVNANHQNVLSRSVSLTKANLDHLRRAEEEPAAKRTQLWISRLGQPHLCDRDQGGDRTDVPVEATEVSVPTVKAKLPRMIPPMLSALQVRPAPPPPRAVSPAAAVTKDLNRRPSTQLRQHAARQEIVAQSYRTDNNNNRNSSKDNNSTFRHIPLAIPPLPQRSLPIAIPRKSSKSESSSDSVLKSLLLESQQSRKRPISPAATADRADMTDRADRTGSTQSLAVQPFDILRRRLLGLDHAEDMPHAASVLTIAEEAFPEKGGDREEDFVKNETAASKPSANLTQKTSYKATSVLKHLLNRYTADATSDSKKEI
jgi:hypothetical protein